MAPVAKLPGSTTFLVSVHYTPQRSLQVAMKGNYVVTLLLELIQRGKHNAKCQMADVCEFFFRRICKARRV